MKKSAIALLTFAVAILTASCQKENISEQVAEYTPMTINAVANGIDIPATKTSLAFKFDVNWNQNDKIYVTDGSNSNTFTLSDGQGTPKGSFTQDGTPKSFTGEVKAYYPSSMVQDDKFIWPAEQKYDKDIQTIPMYCKTTLASGGQGAQRMDFTSLGSVLRITFTTPVSGIKLKSIIIMDDETKMAGAFTVDENGKAIVNQSSGTNSITLDLGTDGVDVSNKINYFNIAVPAGHYQKFSITFTATDGKQCVMTGGNININHNTVGTLSLTGKEFKADVPDGALTGKFSVSATKKVYFSKGNLWYGKAGAATTATLHFEDAQWESTPDSNGSKDANHVSHFTWSSTVEAAVCDYNDGDYLFCDESHKVSVDGGEAIYYALSTEEWQYLFNKGNTYGENNRSGKYKWATVNGVNGYVIAPDDFSGELAGTYADDAALADAGNLVFLPAAGDRNDSSVSNVGLNGLYWSSTAEDEYSTYYVHFNYNAVIPDSTEENRYNGYSVRLITESK